MGILKAFSICLGALPLLARATAQTLPIADLGPIKLDPIKLDLSNLDFFKKSLDLSKIDFAKIDIPKFNFAHGKYSLSSGVLGLKKPLTIPLAPKDASTKDAIEGSLPLLLKQYGVAPGKIAALSKKGAPLLAQVLDTLFEEGDVPETVANRLARRGLFSDIGDFFKDVADAIVDGVESVFDKVVDTFKDVGCGVFATTTLPGFHIAEQAFEKINTFMPQHAYSVHQNYFISAVHGSIYDDGLRVIYGAIPPPGFKKNYGTAFGRKVYLKEGAKSTCPALGFKNQTRLVIHETTHTAQYEDFEYSISAFGVKYLYEYCRAGFSYEKNAMEKAAVAKASDPNFTLLSTYGIGFFQYWDAKNLHTSIGYPTSKAYSTVTTTPKKITELAFERGVIQQTDGNCFRVFNQADLAARKAAQCTIRPPCNNNLRRSPSRPPGSGPRPPSCTPEGVARTNKACNDKKAAWEAKNKKAWDCSATLQTCR